MYGRIGGEGEVRHFIKYRGSSRLTILTASAQAASTASVMSLHVDDAERQLSGDYPIGTTLSCNTWRLGIRVNIVTGSPTKLFCVFCRFLQPLGVYFFLQDRNKFPAPIV